jgi:hypothetical protein
MSYKVSLPARLPGASTRQQIRQKEYAEDQECAQDESVPEMVRKHVLISYLALSQQCIPGTRVGSSGGERIEVVC